MKAPTIELIAVSNLKPNAQNPRKHSKKQIQQIAASMEAFGFTAPLLIDASDQIIAGHGRLLAAARLGMTEVPAVRLANLTPEQIRAYMIADNKLTENSSWDQELLAEHFQILSSLDLDFDLEVTGFETAEIDLMVEGLEPVEEEEPPLPESPGLPVSQPGDQWQLDSHRILCGNSLEKEPYLQLMGDKLAKMIFCDPPYNVPVNGHVSGLGKHRHNEFAMASGEMSPDEFTIFLRNGFSLMAEFSEEGALHFICMDWRHMPEILAAGNQCYTELKNLCVWVKDNGGMGAMYRSRHELVFVFKHGKAPHINNVELGKHGRYRTNVWEYAGANSFSRLHGEEGNTLAMHPTVKPVSMVADAILDCTRRGDIVLDAFLGSGSTLIAAEKTGRCCYGIEIDPRYVDTAIRRWQQWTGGKAIHAESGRTFDEIAAEEEACHEPG